MSSVPRLMPRTTDYETQLKELIRAKLEALNQASELDYAGVLSALHTLGFSLTKLDMAPGRTSDWQYYEFVSGYIDSFMMTVDPGNKYSGTPLTAVGAFNARRGELIFADPTANDNNIVLPDAGLTINDGAKIGVRVMSVANNINVTDANGNNVQGVASFDVATLGLLAVATFKAVDGEWIIV